MEEKWKVANSLKLKVTHTAESARKGKKGLFAERRSLGVSLGPRLLYVLYLKGRGRHFESNLRTYFAEREREKPN